MKKVKRPPAQFIFSNGRVVTLGDDGLLKIGNADTTPKRAGKAKP